MMLCHTDDVIGQIYNVMDLWPDMHIWLVYLPRKYKRQKTFHFEFTTSRNVYNHEVNMRSTEVTDLKWPRGAER